MSSLSIFFIFFAALHIHQGYAQFKCVTCTGGPITRCANVTTTDDADSCKTQCFETYLLYQGGALPLVQRGCWDKPANSTKTNYCDWLPSQPGILNTNATIKRCRTCTTTKCNRTKM